MGIRIKDVVMENETPATVVYFSAHDSRTNVMDAKLFMDNYGYSEEELITWTYANKSAFVK